MTANIEKLADLLGTRVFSAKIRESVSVREAQVAQESIFDYARKGKVTEDYKAFIDEFINGLERE